MTLEDLDKEIDDFYATKESKGKCLVFRLYPREYAEILKSTKLADHRWMKFSALVCGASQQEWYMGALLTLLEPEEVEREKP